MSWIKLSQKVKWRSKESKFIPQELVLNLKLNTCNTDLTDLCQSIPSLYLVMLFPFYMSFNYPFVLFHIIFNTQFTNIQGGNMRTQHYLFIRWQIRLYFTKRELNYYLGDHEARSSPFSNPFRNCVNRKSYHTVTLPTLKFAWDWVWNLRKELLHRSNTSLVVITNATTEQGLGQILSTFHPNTLSTIDHNAILPPLST